MGPSISGNPTVPIRIFWEIVIITTKGRAYIFRVIPKMLFGLSMLQMVPQVRESWRPTVGALKTTLFIILTMGFGGLSPWGPGAGGL